MPTAEEFFGCGGEARSVHPRSLREGVWSPGDVRWARDLACRWDGGQARSIVEAGAEGPTHRGRRPPPRIPRTVHLIWLGGGPLPEHFADRTDTAAASAAAAIAAEEGAAGAPAWNRCALSFRRHHPSSLGWDVRVWTEAEAEEAFPSGSGGSDSSAPRQPMANRVVYRYALSIENYGLASDVLRLEILHRYGGVYADVDYVCVAPLDGLHSGLDFYCGASNVGCVEVNNGLIGAARGHRIVGRMMDEIGLWWRGRGSPAPEPASAPPPPPHPPLALLSSFLGTDASDSLGEVVVAAAATAPSFGPPPTDRPTPEDVIRHTGPGMMTRVLMEVLSRDGNGEGGNLWSDGRVAVLPACHLHPFPNHLRRRVRGATMEGFIDEYGRGGTALALHLWGCSWQRRTST